MRRTPFSANQTITTTYVRFPPPFPGYGSAFRPDRDNRRSLRAPFYAKHRLRLVKMSDIVDKARLQRLQRLKVSLHQHLELPDAALETLLSELQLGEPQPGFWEELHAAAARDGKESDLARAYEKITLDRRLKQFTSQERASVLLHAADFCQGILGNGNAAESYLWRVLETVPDQADAFGRLERRFSAAANRVRLAELYALVAANPPKPQGELAKATLDVISLLPSRSPLSDEACNKLLVLLPACQALLGVLETHCQNTGRFGLACELLEKSLESTPLLKAEALVRRRRLIELYIGDAKTPEKALPHIENLLLQDPTDTQARDAAKRLLSSPQVASKAAAVLQAARQQARERAAGDS